MTIDVYESTSFESLWHEFERSIAAPLSSPLAPETIVVPARGWEMTPLRKMTIGMLTASLAFVVVAMIQARIDGLKGVVDADGNPVLVSILWQFFPYLIMTQAEVMVSITGLEFAYTQAPTRMKSTIMGFWLLSVSLGNKLTAVVTKLPDMDLLTSFWVFAGLMGVAAVLFGIRAAFYKYRYYTQ